MNRHVEIIALELISHLSKLLQRVFSLSLFETEGFHRFGHFLGDAFWTPPVTLGNFRQRWQQTKSVVTVVAAIAEQHTLLVITSSTIVADVLCKLEKRNKIINQLYSKDSESLKSGKRVSTI